ncbi:MAG TPA: hypothetical protein VFU81_20145, partial [Thermomicrobiales bacterium]|nr:hypothetical protein [Thermomicrobiales bacterium]
DRPIAGASPLVGAAACGVHLVGALLAAPVARRATIVPGMTVIGLRPMGAASSAPTSVGDRAKR